MIDLAHQLRAALAPREEIELAVWFGSGARGRLAARSDVDVAIRWRARPFDVERVVTALERTIGRPVDVIDLDSAPPQLRFEIARDGRVVVERTPGAWVDTRARAFVDWWEFAPLARRIHRAALARLELAVGAR